MRVVNLVTRANVGGAGKIVIDHHRALLELGIESWVLTDASAARACDGVPNVEYVSMPFGSARFKLLFGISRVVAGQNAVNISVEPVGSKTLRKAVNRLRPDVIDMHWTSLTFDGLASCEELGVPWVQSLYDMRPFTGACHYSYDCEGYRTSCLSCPMVRPAFRVIPKVQFQAQQRRLGKAGLGTVAGKSKWITECAQKSFLFGGHRCLTIPNGVDTDYWMPQVRRGRSRQLRIVVAGSGSVADPRKGGEVGLEAVRKATESFREGETVVSVAGYVDAATQAKYPDFNFLGALDSSALRDVLRQATVFVLPSVAENLSSFGLQAIASGAPVCAFDVGGNSDFVVDGVSGSLVNSIDSSAMAAALVTVDWKNLRESARDLACDTFTLTAAAQRYKSLYLELVGNGRGDD